MSEQNPGSNGGTPVRRGAPPPPPRVGGYSQSGATTPGATPPLPHLPGAPPPAAPPPHSSAPPPPPYDGYQAQGGYPPAPPTQTQQPPYPPPDYYAAPQPQPQPQYAAYPGYTGYTGYPGQPSGRPGVAPWVWLALGGGTLLVVAIIALVLVLVLTGSRGGTNPVANPGGPGQPVIVGPPAGAAPRDVGDAYYRALVSGDFQTAYNLMAPDAKANTTPDKMKANADQLKQTYGQFQGYSFVKEDMGPDGQIVDEYFSEKWTNQTLTSIMELQKQNGTWLITRVQYENQ